MEAVPGTAVLGNRLLVLEHKGNLDNAGSASAHEGLAKGGMRHGAHHELLGMRRHGPARHQDNKAGNKVALGVTVAVTAKPHACQTGAPPDDAHGGVLPVVLDPGRAPAVLGKRVDAAPGGNDGAIKELL